MRDRERYSLRTVNKATVEHWHAVLPGVLAPHAAWDEEGHWTGCAAHMAAVLSSTETAETYTATHPTVHLRGPGRGLTQLSKMIRKGAAVV